VRKIQSRSLTSSETPVAWTAYTRGAFTGAVSDRRGWLEICEPGGTVFLDEIGDLDLAIQVKLLRVLETRTFQVLGKSVDKKFQGKIGSLRPHPLFKFM
jgi:DNA-binding NtrC family response regulator